MRTADFEDIVIITSQQFFYLIRFFSKLLNHPIAKESRI